MAEWLSKYLVVTKRKVHTPISVCSVTSPESEKYVCHIDVHLAMAHKKTTHCPCPPLTKNRARYRVTTTQATKPNPSPTKHHIAREQVRAVQEVATHHHCIVAKLEEDND